MIGGMDVSSIELGYYYNGLSRAQVNRIGEGRPSSKAFQTSSSMLHLRPLDLRSRGTKQPLPLCSIPKFLPIEQPKSYLPYVQSQQSPSRRHRRRSSYPRIHTRPPNHEVPQPYTTNEPIASSAPEPTSARQIPTHIPAGFGSGDTTGPRELRRPLKLL